MKLVHYVVISVFADQEEDESAIAESLTSLLPADLEKEKISVEVEEAHIEQGRDMKILTVKLEKERHVKHFLSKFTELLGKEQCERIATEENRVDSDGCLFIRLDKISYVDEEKAVLVDHGDCIHFKIMLASYPKTREKALGIAKELFA